MKRIPAFNDWREVPAAWQGGVVALGNFDGVHRGHQTLIAEAARQAGALGAPLVALKMGSEGALLATTQARCRLPAFRVEAVDATGAGDTFDGAFLARLLAGDDVETAGRYANVAAALSTTGYGAVTPMPRRAEVLRALARA